MLDPVRIPEDTRKLKLYVIVGTTLKKKGHLSRCHKSQDLLEHIKYNLQYKLTVSFHGHE